METESIACHLEKLKFSFDFSSCIAVNWEGHSGGVVLFWHNDIDLELLSYSKHHFDA